MTKSDPAILEIFGEAGISISPAVVEYNLTGVSKSTIERRLSELTKYELLQKVDEKRSYYKITPKGEAYLEGDLTDNDLEK